LIVNLLSSVYGAAASWRREWYARDPSRVRRLSRPVISVGNLRVGGAGKTPVVAWLAERLLDMGERPAILSRGYGRRDAPDGVTVVSDGVDIRAGLAVAGDEPLMLARQLPGVRVVVAADRFLAGLLAARELGATLHLLDDGFQHVKLWRDLDLLLVHEADLSDRVLPAGRLREPLQNACRDDALLVPATDPSVPGRIAGQLGVDEVFRVTRSHGALCPIVSADTRPAADSASLHPAPTPTRVLAVAGIAQPARFFDDVAAAGLEVAATMAFRDHHAYSRRDGERIAARAAEAGVVQIVTTEKDAVRLEGLSWRGVSVACLPLALQVEPADLFMAWMTARIVSRP
jgi:tetraacyldisaccharide 4'-kinase